MRSLLCFLFRKNKRAGERREISHYAVYGGNLVEGAGNIYGGKDTNLSPGCLLSSITGAQIITGEKRVYHMYNTVNFVFLYNVIALFWENYCTGHY